MTPKMARNLALALGLLSRTDRGDRHGRPWHAAVMTLLLSGCAHTIPAGLDAAQRGLGAVDLGTDAATEIYTQAVDLCKRNAAVPGCDRIGDPEEVLRKAEALSEAYDSTAAGLDAMQRAYNELAPHFEAAAEVVKGAGMFSR